MRYEIKYAIPLVDEYLINQSILNHPLSFQTAFPDRMVYNIYFDTSELTSYYQNINGDPKRVKLRYRWYKDLSAMNTGRFEIKIKENQLGTKDFFEGQPEEREFDLTQYGLPYHLAPTLLNAYKRSYYVSMDGKFRITLDRKLQFGQPLAALGEISEEQFVHKEVKMILEIKFDQSDYSYFNEVNKYLPFRQTKYSKYAEGISQILF